MPWSISTCTLWSRSPGLGGIAWLLLIWVSLCMLTVIDACHVFPPRSFFIRSQLYPVPLLSLFSLVGLLRRLLLSLHPVHVFVSGGLLLQLLILREPLPLLVLPLNPLPLDCFKFFSGGGHPLRLLTWITCLLSSQLLCHAVRWIRCLHSFLLLALSTWVLPLHRLHLLLLLTFPCLLFLLLQLLNFILHSL